MTRIKVTKNSLLELPKSRSATVLLLGASLSLSACSYVPDWGNPVVWYDSVFRGSSDAPPKADADAARSARGESATAKSDSKSFPSLKTVPERAPQTSSSEEQRQVVQGLVADREGARYTDQVLRAGGTPKPTAPSTRVAKVEPAPQLKPAAAPSPPPKPAARPAPAPQAVAAAPKAVAPAPAPVQRVAKARLPKLDLRPAPRQQVAAVPPPPPPSAVPQTVPPEPVPRPIVEPRSGSQTRAPYPPLVGNVPSRVATAGAPSIVQSGRTAAPQPVPSVVPVAPAQPAAAFQVAALTSVAPEQSVLVQAFAQALAQSASTVTTAPAGTSFGAPAAPPLTSAETPVPDIVRETYNQALISGSGVALAPTAASGSSQALAPGGPATVYFGNGSARLNGKARSVIRDVVEVYKARGGAVRIVGHASHRTRNLPVQRHKLVNFRISLDRATTVANELIKLGVDKGAVQIAAVSDSQPVFYESMPEGEAGNRRAEIFFAF